MNQAQAGLFMIFSLSVLFSGVGLYRMLDRDNKHSINRCVFLGESLLLGGTFLVGELLLLSLLGLYKAQYLWAVVMLNYVFLFDKKTRGGLAFLIPRRKNLGLSFLGFILLLAVFVYRNLYFMVDIDSLISYLFTQKVWLASGSSLVGNATYNSTLFAPQFDSLPSALSLSLPLFAQETLFPEFINIFWRCIALFLVFGYTSYRFNGYYGLSAAILVCLNDHFFFSGVNRWVLINGAVMAFMFAAAYNFWEARRQNSAFRFLLALIFLPQILANKIQVIYIFFFLLTAGAVIQQELLRKIQDILHNRKWLFLGLFSLAFVLLWYLKNFFITGNPFFPVFAGNFGTFGFTSEQGDLFYRVAGGISPSLFLKYMNYLFIWPGINAAKIVIIAVSLFPPLLLLAILKNRQKRIDLGELCFWLGLCILAVMGTALACHWEPRYYRYPMAIMAFAAVASVNFILISIGIRNKIVIGTILFLLVLHGSSNEGYKVIFDQGGYFMRPSFRENIRVLSNQYRSTQAVRKVYPELMNIAAALEANSDKLKSSAWDIMSFNYPLFFLPLRPLVSPWHCTTVKWDSYGDENAVKEDLAGLQIVWVMQMKDKKLVFTSIEDYAREAVKFDKHPTRKYTCYDLPEELCNVYR